MREELSLLCEKLERLSKYLDAFWEPRRFFAANFLAGVARGLGMAVGFTLLGAIFLYFLKYLVLLNLPGISSFIAQVVAMVQRQLAP